MAVLIIFLFVLIAAARLLYKTTSAEEADSKTQLTNYRTMKNPTTTSFVAVDYETMTKDPASICAAGFVKVKDGVIHEQYYTLIKPVDDNRPDTFTYLHGISREMVASAPEYPVAHAKLREMLSDGSPFVCHWVGADVKFMQACREHYNLDDILGECIDTYELSGMSLKNACEHYGIDLCDHHDALCDARACAQLYLALQGYGTDKPKPAKKAPAYEAYESRKVSRKTLSVPTEEEIVNKDTIFYKSNCVITGAFDAFDTREELADTLRSLGADINTAISGKTTIVIVGYDAGPKKLEKIKERQEKGQTIEVIDEDRLLEILESVGL